MHDTAGSVELYWIPLGANGRIVRVNGLIYEAVCAAVQRRERRALYHSVLSIALPHARYMVEMTPVPDAHGASRGVVAEGPVGVRALGRFRLFRYEVRRWQDGDVPDLGHAVGGPVLVTTILTTVRAVFDAFRCVPTLMWGRDELQTGDMWSCNSIIAWALATGGIDVERIPLPDGGRAPGWHSGIIAARRLNARQRPTRV